MSRRKKIYPIDAIRRIPRQTLSSTEKLTLILLLEYLNCDEIFVSAATIGEQGSMSVSTVERAFRRLEELGIMRKERIRMGSSFVFKKFFNTEKISSLAQKRASRNKSLETAPASVNEITFDLSEL